MASVEKLPSGRWRARVTYKSGGAWRQKSFTAETKRDVQRMAALFTGSPSGSIGDMIDDYIEAKTPVLSPSTIRGYKSISRTLRARHAELWRLTDISGALAQEIANECPSPKTSRNIIGLISSAVKFGGGSFPPVSFARWDVTSEYTPSEDDIRAILAEIHGTKMELPVLLGIMGLRRSELVAVTPDDLDGDVLHIHSAIVLDDQNRKVVKATKTRTSDRRISLPHHVAEMLRAGPVELSINSIGKRFQIVTRRLGIRMRFHDLRHFFVSYCHNVLRLTDAQIMHLGGWSTDSVMKRHYRQSMHDDEVAKLVAGAFSATFLPRAEKSAAK